MQAPFRTRVKICCISSLEEAQLAIRLGADALGLVGRMPSGPGVVGDELAAQIVQATPPPLATFMLTSETNVADILAHQQRVGANTIQLVDAVPADTYAQLHAALPTVKVVQVIHVIDEKNVTEALLAVQYGVDALLLDSGNPTLAVKELGGTGRVHNWQVSRQIVEQSPVPVFLAGGLNPTNVREAINAVHPYGLDICSGVRTNGQLDAQKLEAFMHAINP
ncbi:phosphoribosylanthranilate isomerase [Spirosoma pollinicola]|uniref:N-(5'-phosphoribosyl)anthranilate isomerase n=1 Tax=Spirosoma pollinicola TaxID=2057025 RepID=A0A2K8YY51_9BACT|nr:phosphoribosylanthranilate isomerase [Spirosoma pollinicola]AUD02560.1 N-(5'-phosphoribosyl)anthranilate isomerase [Spirosoma pollinicola]